MEQETTQTEEVRESGATQSQDVEVQPDKRVVEDMLKYKQKMKTYEQELEQLRQEQKEAKTKTLAEQQRWKELYEIAQKEADEAKGRLSNFTEGYKFDRKMSAIEMAAKEMGLRSEFMDMLDKLDHTGVVIETTDQGNVNVLGAREFIQGLKSSRPAMFVDSRAPQINTNPASPNMDSKVLSAYELEELRHKDREAYKVERVKFLKAKQGKV